MQEILNKSGFICDMDGVIYRGSKVLPGVPEFIKWMTTDPVAVEWTMATGGIPNCEYGMELLEEKMGEKAAGPMAVLKSMPEGFCNTTNAWYDNVNFGTLSTSLVTVLKDLVYGTTTAEEALAAWETATGEYLATLK